jgi:hypothetical protein
MRGSDPVRGEATLGAPDAAASDMKRAWATTAVGLLISSCGSSQKAVRPDDMGAEAHLEAAVRERTAAREHLREWDAGERKPTVSPALLDGDVYLDSIFWFDPRTWHLEEAERHAARASAHEEAARELEAFEAKECAGLPDASRAACYILGPVSEIRNIEGGVFIRFAKGVDTDAVAAHLRCHLAWARRMGFDQEATCPLDLSGIRFEVVGPAILVLGDDEDTIAEIRRRARLQSTPAWRSE